MALSANAFLTQVGYTYRRLELNAKSAQTFYKGSIVCVDATGLALPAADTANFKCLGVYAKNQTTPTVATVAGDVIEVEIGAFWIPYGSAAQTDVGKIFYVTADDTIALSSTNSVIAGRCIGFKAGFALIDFAQRV